MKIKVENYLGQQLNLNDGFDVIDVAGLIPSGATINTSTAGIADGTFFNSSYTNQRNIVLTIVPQGDAEANRLTLWKYFKPKYKVRLYFKTKTRNVYIDGYVEGIEGSPYSAKAVYQVSVISPNPFFTDLKPIIYEQTYISDGFMFPVSFPESGIVLGDITEGTVVDAENRGEETSGLVIEIQADNSVINPKIYNTSTREFTEIDISIGTGDSIVIDSRRGSKTITLYRNGEAINILNKMSRDSDWISVDQGENLFTFTCDYGAPNMKVLYKIYTLYEGV